MIFCFINAKAQNTETVIIRPGPENGYDAEVRSDRTDPIWYEDDFIANDWTANGTAFIQRSLIRFDLSVIPEGAEILDARLSLFCNTSTGHHQLHSGNNASYLLRITSPWDQYKVTWDNQPSTTMMDLILLPESEFTVQDYLDIDVTNQIDYFYKNPEQNYGFMMQLAEENLYACLVFGSSNHLNPEKRPMLKINYKICTEVKAHFDYSVTNDTNRVQFITQNIDDASYWWVFQNGYYSDLSNPIFTFDHPDVYEVCLTVSNNCSSDTFCDSVYVFKHPEQQFTSISTGLSAAFTPPVLDPEAIYFWDFGDGFSSDEMMPQHTFSQSGSFYVCLQMINKYGLFRYCDTVNFSFLGSNSDNLAIAEIGVFPNPASDLVYISCDKRLLTITSFQIHSMDGKFVREINESVFFNDDSFSIDLSGLDSGIYALIFDTNKGRRVKKVILI
jgi:PKD repeat protein